MSDINFDSFAEVDAEMFRCESLGELDDETDGGLQVGHVITRGTQKSATADDLIDTGAIIDGMSERAWDFAGEAADLGVDVSDDGSAELKALLRVWFDKHVKTSFYAVTNQEKYTITQEDVDSLRGKDQA